jgi:GNAT superfamily N-acetyltransferase
MAELDLLTGTQARPYFDRLIDIYQAAFSRPPYSESLSDFLNFAGRLSYHSRQSGFRCVILRSAPDSEVIGFVYGFPGAKGNWFYDLVSHRLTPALRKQYLDDYFEFAEIAVLPAYQGQGLGGQLHDALLAEVRQTSACLATPEDETNAHHLYRRREWVTLTRGIELPGSVLKFEIMGKILHPKTAV